MNSNITAVVLAGGEGKRFKPFVSDKTLFPFLGRPLIFHTLSLLPHAGIAHALVITNKNNDSVIANLKIDGLTIKTSMQKEPKGMADALLAARADLPIGDMLVMNSVDIVDVSLLKDVVAQSSSHEALVVGLKRERYAPVGYLVFEGDSVVGVIEKPGAGNEPSKYANLVFHYFKHTEKFVSILEKTTSDDDDVYEKAFTTYMKEYKVGLVAYDGIWQKLKYPHFTLDMMDIFLQYIQPHKSDTAIISPHAIIEGNVYIDDGARIFEGAVIKGPAYIGKNAVVGNHCLIRNSVVEESAVIGFGTELARSYIGPRCKLHHNFVGDSVFESDINPSYGTVTANWRIDGNEVDVKYESGKISSERKKFGALIAKGAFLGVNCTLLPGVAIGAGARIYPGTLVHSFVAPGATLKSYQKQE